MILLGSYLSIDHIHSGPRLPMTCSHVIAFIFDVELVADAARVGMETFNRLNNDHSPFSKWLIM